jgi:hypothetical protein
LLQILLSSVKLCVLRGGISFFLIVHIRQDNFGRFGIPEPKPGEPDYVTLFHRSVLRSALDKRPKNHYSEVLVLRCAGLGRDALIPCAGGAGDGGLKRCSAGLILLDFLKLF